MPQMYWIIPVETGGRPDNTLPGQPPGIWGPNSPIISNPIAPGGTTPPWGIPEHRPIIGNPIVIPPDNPGGQPPGIWIPVFPTNPIVVGPGGQPGHPGKPPGTWGGGGIGDYIDAGLPPAQPLPPDELPGLPEPPAELADKIVVAVHKPGEEWVVKAYDPNARPDHGLPPYAQPKG
jgi:hypothetical protein